MKIKQLDLFAPANLTAKQIKFGDLFLANNTIFMRVKPVNFLTNSTLLNDVINRGDIFAVNMEKGTLVCYTGNTEVEAVTAELQYKK